MARRKKGKLKGKIKGFLKKAKDKIKKAGGNVKWAPVFPFKGVMSDYLKLKGIPHSNNIEDIAVKFYKNVVKRGNFVDDPANFDEGYDLDPATIAIVISAIVTFIKKLKEKKERGEALSSDEEKILQGAQQITQAIQEEAELTVAEQIRQFMFSWKGAVTLVGLLVLLYVAFGRGK